MSIHDLVARGDLPAVEAALVAGASLEAVDDQGRTPLAVAVSGPEIEAGMLRLLLEHGADANARMIPPVVPQLSDEARAAMRALGMDTSAWDQTEEEPVVDSVLSYAARQASAEQVRLLLEAGADFNYVNAGGYSVLTSAMFRPPLEPVAQHLAVLNALLDAGAPLDKVSRHGESALSVASQRGMFEAVLLLVERGADPRPLDWNALHLAVAHGDLNAVAARLDEGADLEYRDAWQRTPLLLAIQAGQRRIAELLLARGADRQAKGRCGQAAVTYAIHRDDAEMLRWLIAEGSDIEEVDDFGHFPLLEAARSNAMNCARVLIAAGATVERATAHGSSPIKDATGGQMVELLMAAGAELSGTEPEVRQTLLGHDPAQSLDVPEDLYFRFRHRRFGRSNPERMNNPLWDALVRTRTTAWACARQFEDPNYDREAVWCFRRFGQTLTRLPDGRYVEIAGEHEDFYDPDFCIYNDVVVHRGQGQFELYGYPEHVFPPTDFHTATLIWPHIYLIGNLGYVHQRRPGETPVYRLSCESWSIERLDSSGQAPGWIHRHRAELRANGTILVRGGQILDGGTGKMRDNTRQFVFTPSSGSWSVAAP
ncbi:MAG: ankyrin repeat domain-containing protein [Pirellulaceae bacterium]|nr:ankyrin repeat domain-containing protein [Pirellulaceae bacterium]